MSQFLSKRLSSLKSNLASENPALRAGFLRTTSWRGLVFSPQPVGWSKRTARRLQAIRDTVATHIQSLNDRYADPSGKGDIPFEAMPAAERAHGETQDKSNPVPSETATLEEVKKDA